MSKSRAHQDFEAELQYHKREWLVERIGWIAMLAFVVAALFGLFGDGPLSTKTAGDPATAAVKYDRFIRYAAPTVLELAIAKNSSGTIALEIDEAYLRDFEVTTITPQPSSEKLVGDRHRFEFDLAAAPTTIAMRMKPEKIGSKRGSFVVAGTQIDIAQLVYP